MPATKEVVKSIGQCGKLGDIGSRLADGERELALEIGLDELEQARRDGRYYTEVFALSSQMYARVAVVEEDDDSEPASS